jgi:hypothetical protein
LSHSLSPEYTGPRIYRKQVVSRVRPKTTLAIVFDITIIITVVPDNTCQELSDARNTMVNKSDKIFVFLELVIWLGVGGEDMYMLTYVFMCVCKVSDSYSSYLENSNEVYCEQAMSETQTDMLGSSHNIRIY